MEFVAIARDPFHRRICFLHRQLLDSCIPDEIPVDQDIIASFGHGRAIELTLALCLAEDSQPPPGLPTVQGQWISRKKFEIKLRTAPSLFDIQALSDQEWISRGFPARTFALINRERSLNEELAEDETVAIGFVHEDAYNVMANGSNGPMLQALVAVDMLVDVILDIDAAQPGTPLERLLDRLSHGGEKVTIGNLQRWVRDEPKKLKALLQAKLNVVSSIR
jgi:hypothetical protein